MELIKDRKSDAANDGDTVQGAARGKSFFRRRHIKGFIGNILYMILTACISFFIEEYIWNPAPEGLSTRMMAVNAGLELVLLTALMLILRWALPAHMLVVLLNWAYGLLNHYVLIFKGIPPQYCDLKAIDTAVTVAGSYTFEITDQIKEATAIMLVYFLLMIIISPSRIPKLKSAGKEVLSRLLGLAGAAALLCGLVVIDTESFFSVPTDGWDPAASFSSNGAPIMFLVTQDNSKMKKPAGYSAESVEELLASYDSSKDMEVKPDVIVIMNESFSDLGVLSDFDMKDCLEKFYNIDDYLMRGYVYPSTYGGGTCNSEFEFLTGASMISIGYGMYPYQFYDLSKAGNLTSLFARLGYDTIAFHPYEPENWNRIKVYDQFGFRSFLSFDDMDEYDTFSWTVTDRSDYRKVIQLQEESDEPLFLFNVTMQNHGAYDVTLSPELETVYPDEEYSGYEDLVIYMTLMKESDRAFAELLDYYREKDDPVIICMFGDHQPSMNEEFMNSVWKDSPVDEYIKKMMTPYMIWANYDTGLEQKEVDMGINYLAANLLDILDVHTEYSSYLLDMQEQIPAVNVNGYKKRDGSWHSKSEDNARMEEYSKVQYYQLFDRR